MNTDQAKAHERMLSQHTVRTVHRCWDEDLPPREPRPAQQLSAKNQIVLAAERAALVLRFMKPGSRYTAFELGAVVDVDGMARYNLIDRLLKRGRIIRHGGPRGRWYSRK